MLIEPGDRQLRELFGLVQILQAVRAEVEQLRAGRKAAFSERPRRPGEEDLATVAGGCDPRRPVHVHADIAVAADAALAGVHADPDADADIARPCFGGEVALDGDCSRDGRRG